MDTWAFDSVLAKKTDVKLQPDKITPKCARSAPQL